MIKHICDICHKGEATNHYKIKKLEDICTFDDHGVFPKKMWVDIDICTSCLIDITQGKLRDKDGSNR